VLVYAVRLRTKKILSSRRARGLRRRSPVRETGTDSGADLGGSSNIQMGTLKTDEEKGSLSTVVGQGLVGPKR